MRHRKPMPVNATGCSLQAAARRFRSTMSFGYACARSHGWAVAHASRNMKELLAGYRYGRLPTPGPETRRRAAN